MCSILVQPKDIIPLYRYDCSRSTFDTLSNLEEIDNISFCEGGHDFIDTVSGVSGVYFICTDRQFLYIGWSKNIRKRLKQHKGLKRSYLLCRAVTIFWTECMYPELEYFLIRKLKPVLNKVRK